MLRRFFGRSGGGRLSFWEFPWIILSGFLRATLEETRKKPTGTKRRRVSTGFMSNGIGDVCV